MNNGHNKHDILENKRIKVSLLVFSFVLKIISMSMTLIERKKTKNRMAKNGFSKIHRRCVGEYQVDKILSLGTLQWATLDTSGEKSHM